MAKYSKFMCERCWNINLYKNKQEWLLKEDHKWHKIANDDVPASSTFTLELYALVFCFLQFFLSVFFSWATSCSSSAGQLHPRATSSSFFSWATTSSSFFTTLLISMSGDSEFLAGSSEILGSQNQKNNGTTLVTQIHIYIRTWSYSIIMMSKGWVSRRHITWFIIMIMLNIFLFLCQP